MKILVLALLCSSLLFSSTAMAGRCEDLAKPKSFNKHTAMEAIFCEYNRTQGGTLLPLKYTQAWNAKKAETLATPILAATYRENGVRKGVIAIQRQMLENGEPYMSHATTAVISVYVFKHDGSTWVFEKGKRAVTNAGAHGFASGGKLVKLGQEKYGLWFEGGDIHQGYTTDYAFIIALSESKIRHFGAFDTGQTNQGACSDDPAERGNFVNACWGYEGLPEFIKAQDSDYYIFRIKYQGTEAPDFNDTNKIVPKNEPVCYTTTGEKYLELKDRACAPYKALDVRVNFGIGDSEEGSQPIPSIPRKMLK
jgi:hypothetical protein